MAWRPLFKTGKASDQAAEEDGYIDHINDETGQVHFCPGAPPVDQPDDLRLPPDLRARDADRRQQEELARCRNIDMTLFEPLEGW